MKLFGSKRDRYERNHCGSQRKERNYIKSILPICLVLFFAVCLTIGGTLAFMQEKTGTVTNTFKAGNITYTLNLNANENDVEMPSDIAARSSTYLSVDFELDKEPTKTGYTFIGWYYDADCTKQYPSEYLSDYIITINYSDENDSDEDANKVEITLYA